MLEREYRALNASERELVSKMAHQRTVYGATWVRIADAGIHFIIGVLGLLTVGLLVSGLLFLLVRLVLGHPPGETLGSIILVFPPAFGAGFGAALLYRNRTSSSNGYPVEPASELAEVIHATATDAVLMEEWEDEGMHYFLDVGNGRILYLTGQYLEDLVWNDRWYDRNPEASIEEREEGADFPNRAFRFVFAHYSGEFLSFEPLGEPFRPSIRLEAASLTAPLPPDRSMFTGSLETLEADLQRWAETPAALVAST